MTAAVSWTVVVLVIGVVGLLVVLSATDPPVSRERRPVVEPEPVFRLQPLPPPTVVRHDDEDAQAIRDHELLVEQYRGLLDELYDFGKSTARRARREP